MLISDSKKESIIYKFLEKAYFFSIPRDSDNYKSYLDDGINESTDGNNDNNDILKHQAPPNLVLREYRSIPQDTPMTVIKKRYSQICFIGQTNAFETLFVWSIALLFHWKFLFNPFAYVLLIGFIVLDKITTSIENFIDKKKIKSTKESQKSGKNEKTENENRLGDINIDEKIKLNDASSR